MISDVDGQGQSKFPSHMVFKYFMDITLNIFCRLGDEQSTCFKGEVQ